MISVKDSSFYNFANSEMFLKPISDIPVAPNDPDGARDIGCSVYLRDDRFRAIAEQYLDWLTVGAQILASIHARIN